MKLEEKLALEAYPVNYTRDTGRKNPDLNAPFREAFLRGWRAREGMAGMMKAISEMSELDPAIDEFCYGRHYREWWRDPDGWVNVVLPEGEKVRVRDWKLTSSEISTETLRRMAEFFFNLGMSTLANGMDAL